MGDEARYTKRPRLADRFTDPSHVEQPAMGVTRGHEYSSRNTIHVNGAVTLPPAQLQQADYWVPYWVPVINGLPQPHLAQPFQAQAAQTFQTQATQPRVAKTTNYTTQGNFMHHQQESSHPFPATPPAAQHNTMDALFSPIFDFLRPQPMSYHGTAIAAPGPQIDQPHVFNQTQPQAVPHPGTAAKQTGPLPAGTATVQENPFSSTAPSATVKAGDHHCSRCPKTYNNARSLRFHVASKHNIDPYSQCPECTARFTTDDKLSDHWDAVHERDSQRPTPSCEYCGRAFAAKKAASVHKRKCPARPKDAGTGAPNAGAGPFGSGGAGGAGGPGAFLTYQY